VVPFHLNTPRPRERTTRRIRSEFAVMVVLWLVTAATATLVFTLGVPLFRALF
jgi:hypothetical protein